MSEQTVTFENVMSSAEQIAARLSSGACSLDEAISLYEEGAALLTRASQELARIEQRARELVAEPNGTFSVIPIGSPSQGTDE